MENCQNTDFQLFLYGNLYQFLQKYRIFKFCADFQEKTCFFEKKVCFKEKTFPISSSFCSGEVLDPIRIFFLNPNILLLPTEISAYHLGTLTHRVVAVHVRNE